MIVRTHRSVVSFIELFDRRWQSEYSRYTKGMDAIQRLVLYTQFQSKPCEGIESIHSNTQRNEVTEMNTFYRNKIRGRMAELGYNNEHIAYAIKKSTNTVSNKLIGKTPITVSELIEIANLLNVNIGYFFTDTFGVKANNKSEHA